VGRERLVWLVCETADKLQPLGPVDLKTLALLTRFSQPYVKLRSYGLIKHVPLRVGGFPLGGGHPPLHTRHGFLHPRHGKLCVSRRIY
jgi:hypothetical protein